MKTLKEYQVNNIISYRTLNVCLTNNLKTIDDLVNYFDSNKGFDNLRHSGPKSKEELIEVCKELLWKPETKKQFFVTKLFKN